MLRNTSASPTARLGGWVDSGQTRGGQPNAVGITSQSDRTRVKRSSGKEHAWHAHCNGPSRHSDQATIRIQPAVYLVEDVDFESTDIRDKSVFVRRPSIGRVVLPHCSMGIRLLEG